MLKVELSYRGLIAIGLALLGLWFVIRLWPVLILLITALIFMAALLPYVGWLERHRIRRGLAVLIVLLVVVFVLAALLYLVVPAMLDEFSHLRTDLPQDARALDTFLNRFGFSTNLEKSANDLDWGSLISGRAAVSYGTEALFLAISTFSVIVLTVYLLIDTHRIEDFIYQFVPPGREPEMVGILQSLGRVVGGYVRGQFITCAVIAVYTLVVCLVVGIPNAIAFGVLAGFADIIPVAGAFLSIAPASAAGLRESPTQALIVAGLLLLYQQFEDRILVPRVYSRTLNIPPLIVLIAVLAGGQVLGITGVLLALPAAAAARVGLDYWLNQRRSNAPSEGSTGDPMAPDSPQRSSS
ncbi:MAG: AI-2E family transporter [Tepidiformaceae bacterium]